MIRRLIILLLIVGCAHKPPTTNFYIGMTYEEFKEKNLNTKPLQPLPMTDKKMWIENVGSFNEYIFGFNNDTLQVVYHNAWNMVLEREIDYSKYATPTE